jgi:mitosis inhibitor protein kinase SWE1
MEPEGDRAYMAPEILFGTYSKPADIFSFGLLILECMTGIIMPQNGPDWIALRNGALRSFTEWKLDFGRWPREIVAIVERMIVGNAQERVVVGDLVEEIERVRAALGVIDWSREWE